ncbi:hypothetical protein CkaCkLH20_05222 [Colletotrichum karsti]|uniref:Transcription factor domain-containing protein n=1 Tax=Colletotrichum karsti TaxID=1095194 RepID=A0A9P6I870_9PEZI|nr:uncharacterized protein CkaCkLH20_05222 [Colletotrichum karsti]KAF9877522.1 hypothetical protein CkaCkLH20_05222 [Colletotrichum karsti]
MRSNTVPAHPVAENLNDTFTHDDSQNVAASDTLLSTDGIANDLYQNPPGGFLPSLFDDTLDVSQFDSIFRGDSEDDLDNFFANLFSLPSFPRASVGEPSGLAEAASPVHGYTSDADVLGDYYTHLHNSLPLLPPPPSARTTSSSSSAAYNPSSPLLLSLLSILTLIPATNTQPPDPSLKSTAESLAQKALAAIDTFIPSTSPSTLHAHLPQSFETALTYCVLSLFQYLHRGDIEEMTRLAEKGFELARRLVEEGVERYEGVYDEALRRMWWMSYVCLCQASISWRQYILAEETLVSATLLLVALIKGIPSESAIPSFNRNIHLLESLITHQLDALAPCTSIEDGQQHQDPESKLEASLGVTSRIRLMSARIKLHRYRAFISNIPILRIFESLLQPTTESQQHTQPIPSHRERHLENVARVFPFAREDSLRICVDSATTIAVDLEGLVRIGCSGTVPCPPSEG